MYKGNFTDKATGWQVIGWASYLAEEDRKVSTLSDGSVFPSEGQAKQYVIDSGMHLMRIDEVANVYVFVMAFTVESRRRSLAGLGHCSANFWSYFQVKQRTEAYKYIYYSEGILELENLFYFRGMPLSGLISDEIQEQASNGFINYELSQGELEWLDFVRGRYSIADYLLDSLDEDNFVRIDSEGLSKALDDDNRGVGKAVCLSDETALQKIFFWCYNESEVVV